MKRKICAYIECKKEFIFEKTGLRKYCSVECRDKQNLIIRRDYQKNYRKEKRKTQKKKCLNCNKEFMPSQKYRNYCSEKCNKERYTVIHMTAINICLYCEKHFKTNKIGQKFCSEQCEKLCTNESTTIKRVCFFSDCNNVFTPRNSRQIYCCSKCLDKERYRTRKCK